MPDFFDNRYYHINKFFLSYIGQWPFHSARRNIFIMCFINMNHFLFLIIKIAGFCKVWSQADKMIKCLPTIFTGFGSIIYNFVLLANREKLSKLFLMIKSDWEFPFSKDEQLIISHHSNNGRIYTIVYAVNLIGSLMICTLTTLTPNILDIIMPLNESRPKHLPFELHYFVNYSEDYFYWIMLHIKIMAFLELFSFIGSESLLGVFSEHACGLFKIIGLRLKGLSDTCSERNNLQTVVECIEHHNRAIEFCIIVDSVFRSCFFLVIIFNTILISACLIPVVLNLDKFDIVVSFGVFVIAAVIHIFLNSFPAQKLMDYSTALADNLYDGTWYQMPTRIKKYLLIIMMRSQIPCTISAGILVDLSLKTVFSVVRSSFSYFTLMLATTT